MITHLHGRLAEVLPTVAVVDVGGVGYEVLIPLSSFDKLPAAGQEVRLLTHLVVREDAHLLYGFVTAAERELFRLLVNTVSGIGPKIALNVLSGMSVTSFRSAVAAGDFKALASISGVGKKTAERMVVELRDKLQALAAQLPAARAGDGRGASDDDLVAALVNLGYKPSLAEGAVGAARKDAPEAAFHELLRLALRRLSRV